MSLYLLFIFFTDDCGYLPDGGPGCCILLRRGHLPLLPRPLPAMEVSHIILLPPSLPVMLRGVGCEVTLQPIFPAPFHIVCTLSYLRWEFIKKKQENKNLTKKKRKNFLFFLITFFVFFSFFLFSYFLVSFINSHLILFF